MLTGLQLRIPAALMRGGTSKAVFFKEDDLRLYDADVRRRIFLAALGSPDPYGRQIDGLGGGTSSTSKIAVIRRPTPPADVDVEFLFAQVDVKRPEVDFRGTCGNISAAVGPFAIEEGLVAASEPVTHVRVLAVNTGKVFIAHVPTQNGQPLTEGDLEIDGVPGSGAPVALEFLDPGGSLGRGLLPTGSPSDMVQLADGRALTVSIVDAANPFVFVPAHQLGVAGTGLPSALERDAALMHALAEVRAIAAVRLGLAEAVERADETSPAIPKVALVAEPSPYITTRGRPVGSEDVDLVARAISMGRVHATYPLSGAIATAVAAALPGTVVHSLARGPEGGRRVRIGHPAGVLAVDVKFRASGSNWRVDSVTAYRTARRIMDGYVYVPRSVCG